MARAAADVERLVELYGDGPGCALACGLHYVTGDEPGIVRRRCGRGFSYRDARRRPVSAATRSRIVALAVPPAWRDVWISADPDAHLLATGVDDRGRKQYLYHERWREFRDVLNFYRLIDVGRRLPDVRADIEAQLRRRTLDREVVLAAMLRIVDVAGLRIGNEEYAEENDSVGLTTLTRRHVSVEGSRVRFRFPAKSGKPADIVLEDRAVARVLGRLNGRRRLFTVEGAAVSADDVNARLAALTDERVSAKDFRTWRGTLTAFTSLRATSEEDREAAALAAIDAAASALGNTRAVARAHYVHPHLIEAYLDDRLDALVAARRAPRVPGLTLEERQLLGVLGQLLAEQVGDRALSS